MQQICQICCSPKRRLRFHTEQLAICQWCVTELSTADKSPASIINEKRQLGSSRHHHELDRELARLVTHQKPVPTMPTNIVNQAEEYAEMTVRSKEGVLQSIYRTMFDSTTRLAEIGVLAAQRREELLSMHKLAIEEHAKHQREIESKIKLLEARRESVENIVENEIRTFLDESINSETTTTKDVRLIRAYFCDLINYERTKIVRPPPEEYEALKKKIRSRDSFRCVCCLRGIAHGELHVHHVLPLSLCGSNAPTNLVTLCYPCHNKQHPKFHITQTYPVKRRKTNKLREINNEFIAVDILTTGFSNDDSIIEIAASRFINGKVDDVFCSLIRTKRPVPIAISRVTGITQAMIETPRTQQKLFNTLWPLLLVTN